MRGCRCLNRIEIAELSILETLINMVYNVFEID